MWPAGPTDRGEDNSTVFWCENGVMKIGTDLRDQVIVELRDGSVERYQVGEIATNEKQTKSGVIDAFVDSILNGTASPVPGEEGREIAQSGTGHVRIATIR